MSLLLSSLVAASLAGQPAPVAGPITLGESFKLQSPQMREERTVNVVLPLGYAEHAEKRWPVLYVIDGGVDQDLVHVAGAAWLGAMWGRNQDAIVVGVATKDRRKELVGPTRDPKLLKQYPTAGHSADFRAFIRDAVKPMVKARYRTDGHDAVIGESLAGLFIVETWLQEPGLFGTYAAIDPSLWWDEESLSKSAARSLSGRKAVPRLYVAWAKETSDEPGGLNRFLAALPKTGERCLNQRVDLGHSTIYQQLSPQALQFLFPPASPPPPEFGFEVVCSRKS